MSAGNAIILPSGGSAPTYRGACRTVLDGGSQAGFNNLSSVAMNIMSLQHGAAPVGMTISSGGLLIANAGLYRVRGKTSDYNTYSETVAFNSSILIMVAGAAVASEGFSPVAESNNSSGYIMRGDIDALISVTANQLVQLGIRAIGGNISFGGFASLKVESMF
jgi:hypothetical protein